MVKNLAIDVLGFRSRLKATTSMISCSKSIYVAFFNLFQAGSIA